MVITTRNLTQDLPPRKPLRQQQQLPGVLCRGHSTPGAAAAAAAPLSHDYMRVCVFTSWLRPSLLCCGPWVWPSWRRSWVLPSWLLTWGSSLQPSWRCWPSWWQTSSPVVCCCGVCVCVAEGQEGGHKGVAGALQHVLKLKLFACVWCMHTIGWVDAVVASDKQQPTA